MNNLLIKTNRLSAEKSPYLLQHQDNPVWWYSWCEEAFIEAKKENKPVFLSIGYSTCYWCHVMEKDSFENEDVAQLLNDHFISIKVDREERPDIDAIYMDAVVGMTGRGGWPMSVFLTPDKEPFWGGTFFYNAQFQSILSKINQAWLNKKEEILDSSSKVTQFLKERSGEFLNLSFNETLDKDFFKRVTAGLIANYDSKHGGFGSAPKFPPTSQLTALLRLSLVSADNSLSRQVSHTLKSMVSGGIYDHLAGGFARYSTDERWIVPHFEKMLYDNALILDNLGEAYQLTADAFFLRALKESADFLLNNFFNVEGGFYSAQDAGDVGKEGEYYVWAYKDLESLLNKDQFQAIEKYFDISMEGNFEAKHIVLSLRDALDFVKQDPNLTEAFKILKGLRDKREAPLIDKKILTAWNGLIIKALSKVYKVTLEKVYLDAALRAANFIRNNLYTEGRLLRRYFDGEASIEGMLEDYAYLIDGLIELYQVSGEGELLNWAKALQEEQNKVFLKEGGFISSALKDILHEKYEFLDGATPSANAVSWINLLRLDRYFNIEEFRSAANKIKSIYLSIIAKYPYSVSSAVSALAYDSMDKIELVNASKKQDFTRLLELLRDKFLPNILFAYQRDPFPINQGRKAAEEGESYYVCISNTCHESVDSSEKVLNLLKII